MATYQLATNLPVIVRYMDPLDMASPILYGDVSPPISMRGVNTVGIELSVTDLDKKGDSLSLNVYADGSNDRAVWTILSVDPLTTLVLSASTVGMYSGSVPDIGTRYIRIWYVIAADLGMLPTVDAFFRIDVAAHTLVGVPTT